MGRSGELLTRRQLSVLMLFSMISPLFRQVPRSVLAWAGAWTVPAVLVGVGAFLLTVAAAGALWSRWGRGEGLGEALLRSLGNGVGRAVLALYTLWFSFYAGFVLRSGAERFVSAVYTEMPVALLMAVLMLPVVTAALGRGKVLARCAELLLPPVLAVPR